MERVGISLSMYNKNHELDIILFPELTFTGYNFKDSIDALPFSCLQNEGYQFSFVRQLAIRL